MKQKMDFIGFIRILYPPVLYLFFMMMVQTVVGAVLMSIVGVGNVTNKEANDILMRYIQEMNVLSMLVSIPIFASIMYYDTVRDKKLNIYVPMNVQKWWKFLLIIPIAFTTMVGGNNLAIVLAAYMPGDFIDKYAKTESLIYDGSVLVITVSTVILAPIIEEIVFRGIVLKRLNHYFNFVVSAVISAGIFGIFHLNAVQGVYAFAVGLVLAFIYYNYGIIGCILLHMCANGFSVLFTFIGSGAEGSIKDIEFTGDLIQSALTGAGTFAVITVFLMIIIAAVCKKNNVENINQ